MKKDTAWGVTAAMAFYQWVHSIKEKVNCVIDIKDTGRENIWEFCTWLSLLGLNRLLLLFYASSVVTTKNQYL